MKNIDKIFGKFILIGILNFLIFILYLKSTKYSGGEIGMMPFLVLISSGISLVISTIIVLIIKTTRNLNFTKSILIYHTVYFVTLIYWGIDWNEILNFSYQNIDLFIILISLFVWGLLWMLTKILSKKNSNKSIEELKHFIDEQTTDERIFAGTTVNERLYLSGLTKTFDDQKTKNKEITKYILKKIKVDENSIEQIIKDCR